MCNRFTAVSMQCLLRRSVPLLFCWQIQNLHFWSIIAFTSMNRRENLPWYRLTTVQWLNVVCWLTCSVFFPNRTFISTDDLLCTYSTAGSSFLSMLKQHVFGSENVPVDANSPWKLIPHIYFLLSLFFLLHQRSNASPCSRCGQR